MCVALGWLNLEWKSKLLCLMFHSCVCVIAKTAHKTVNRIRNLKGEKQGILNRGTGKG